MAEAPQAAPAPSDGMPAGWPRRLAVATITIGLMMSVLSNSMTNLALPYIAQDLNISAESSIWIVNATQIALVVSLLPVAALADIVGYRHVYRFGLVLFSLASIGCAFAPSLPWLLLGRTFQGLGGAAIMSVQPALVRAIYPRATRPWPGLQHHRGRHLARRRTVDRRGAAHHHVVADPVRRLCAAGPHLLYPGGTLPAAHHAHPPAVRRAVGGDVGRHLRAADLRHRRHGARPSKDGGRLRARPRRGVGHPLRVAPDEARRSD